MTEKVFETEIALKVDIFGIFFLKSGRHNISYPNILRFS